MATKSKKGRNPGAVDSWLDSLGLYRKNVAYDETCLFRSVSEQLFACQIHHERVRREVVEFGRNNYFEFWDMLQNANEWYDHMDLLEKHMVVCGNIEIQIISKKYKRNVMVFDAAKNRVCDVTQQNHEENLMLCLMNEDHYDVIYKREKIHNAGFCQSIVYGLLYEEVFKVPDVQSIVYGMLYDKEFVAASAAEVNNNEDGDQAPNLESGSVVKSTITNNIAPFPFKVAKALDPTIYRNIEYDSWTEIRREMRLGDWYHGDDNLILGTRCLFNCGGETLECYIQEILKNENKCVVYVTKLAQKKLVNYTDLSPENDAKPWPLPYRFSKNLLVSNDTKPSEKTPSKPLKKRCKDKKRIKSNSESSNTSAVIITTSSDLVDPDIKAFVGIPLQMQDNIDRSQDGPMIETPQSALSQHNLLITPEVSSPMPKFSWEAPWPNYAPLQTDQVVWSPAPVPQNLINYTLKPMVASAPVTPDVIPYHDTGYPYLYNYHIEHQYSYNGWAAQDYRPQAEEPPADGEAPPAEHSACEQREQERPAGCAANAAASPQLELYSPMIQLPPGTPVIYAHPPPELSQLGMQAGTPMHVYTPPIDVQYVSPGPFCYPPTPPTSWYPPGINSQGFIFPSPVNQNNSK